MHSRLAMLVLTALSACAAASSSPSGGHGGSGGLSITSGPCDSRCSSDLHDLLDCNGNVLMTCPPDQGCSKHGCVPACESASDNKSSIGCDYYSVDPDVIDEVAGSCFAAFIANTWTAPVSVQLERAGVSVDAASYAYLPSGSGESITYTPLPNGQIPPGEVAIVFLAAIDGQPVLAPCPFGVAVAYTAADAAVHGTGIGDAIHITTSAPVVAYDILPYGGGQTAATSATLLLPTSAWDTGYIAIDAFPKSEIEASARPSIDIVAAEDATHVTILPTRAILAAAGVAGGSKGQPQTYTLNKGQVLQFTQSTELIGSPIQADKPIGVWGGASCLSIDVDQQGCDSAHQQIPPIKALGHEYAAVRYRDRFDGQEENPPWRIVGAVDGTVLTYDPEPPAGAPTTITTGHVVVFTASQPFTVASQDANHPFYLSGHMTGCVDQNPTTDDCRGDPEFVNVIPAAQYLSSYVFFTDPTYPETDLVLVRAQGKSGFDDVTLDCAGVVAGWQPIGKSGRFEYTRVDLVRHDFEPQGACDNGVHAIRSRSPFGLVVWGWGTAETGGCFGQTCPGFYSQGVSYAYPAGASVLPINSVVVPPVPR